MSKVRKRTWQYQGRVVTLTELACETGLSYSTLYTRLITKGMDADKAVALGKQASERMYEWRGGVATLSQISEECGISRQLLGYRMKKYQITAEEAADIDNSKYHRCRCNPFSVKYPGRKPTPQEAHMIDRDPRLIAVCLNCTRPKCTSAAICPDHDKRRIELLEELWESKDNRRGDQSCARN